MLREEGSNGDREMLMAFHEAGLEAWDVNMHDLLQGEVVYLFEGWRVLSLLSDVWVIKQ